VRPIVKRFITKRFGVSALSMEEVVGLLAAEFGLSFECRDSSFWGDYYRADLSDCGSVTVNLNDDPMYRPDTDPPEDAYFESAFPEYGVLVFVNQSVSEPDAIGNALRVADPTTTLIREDYYSEPDDES